MARSIKQTADGYVIIGSSYSLNGDVIGQHGKGLTEDYWVVKIDFNGKIVWETILGASISSSTITYAVNGRQYIAVIAGDNLAAPGLIAGTMGPVKVDITPPRGANALYVFALPQKR